MSLLKDQGTKNSQASLGINVYNVKSDVSLELDVLVLFSNLPPFQIAWLFRKEKWRRFYVMYNWTVRSDEVLDLCGSLNGWSNF